MCLGEGGGPSISGSTSGLSGSKWPLLPAAPKPPASAAREWYTELRFVSKWLLRWPWIRLYIGSVHQLILRPVRTIYGLRVCFSKMLARETISSLLFYVPALSLTR